MSRLGGSHARPNRLDTRAHSHVVMQTAETNRWLRGRGKLPPQRTEMVKRRNELQVSWVTLVYEFEFIYPSVMR